MAALISRTRYELLTGTSVPVGDQPRVEALLEAASDAIREECGWHIAPVELGVTMTVDGSDGLIQNLPTLHLTAVTSVTDDERALTASEFHWSERGQLTKGSWRSGAYGARWTWKPRGVVAVVDHGYPACPASIELLLCALVKNALPLVPAGVKSESKGPFSITYADDAARSSIVLSEADKAALARYALPPTQRAGV
jgi:hypothetical protein